MPDTVVAAQMYTLRDLCKTPADNTSSLKRVAEIGYQAVPLSGLGPMDDKELKNVCDG